MTIASIIGLYVGWPATHPVRKRRTFQVVATMLALVPSLAVIDLLLRSPEAAHYVRDSQAYHRPPHKTFQVVMEDKPQAARTYPNAPPGYPSRTCTGTFDRRGYRNRVDLETYDVVVLGDSFAEGSGVSDDDVWPARLASTGGWSVYNLGMSGYDPSLYLESLLEHGLALKPKYVLCTLYEGNDFRSAKADRKRRRPSISSRVKRYVKQSPIVTALDETLIGTFGPMNANGPVPGAEILDWLPLAIPSGPAAKYYALQPKQLRDIYRSGEGFALDRHWLNPRGLIAAMKQASEEAGATFVLLFAPTKAHVTLPMVARGLPAEPVRAFTSLRYKGPLPEPEEFLGALLRRTDACESVVRDWCRREGIRFVSLTTPLREAAA